MKGQGDPESGVTGFVIATGTALVVVTVLVVVAYYRSYTASFFAERVTEQDSPALMKMQQEERGRLESYGMADDDSGMARIPIDVAMDMMVEKADAGR